MKTLSVVVPCYNVEKYICQCLDSLLDSAIEGMEIICVDDGSVDDTPSILQRYQENHSEIVKVITSTNEGAWAARLKGIRSANGAYTSFIDADDTVEKGYAELLYSTAIQHNADLVVCGYSRVDMLSGKVLAREFCEEREPIDFSKESFRILEINPAFWNKAFRTNAIKDLPLLPTKPVQLEDLAFLLLYVIRNQGITVFLAESLINYRQHADSLIHEINVKQITRAEKTLLEVRDACAKESSYPNFKEVLSVCAFLHLGISMVFRACSSKSKLDATFIDSIFTFLNQEFPDWSSSRYITLNFALFQRRSYRLLALAALAYKCKIFIPLIRLYSSIANLGIEVKWG